MPNIHQYVLFDRADVDPILSMRWSELEEHKPGWFQWDSAREFLVEYGLDPKYVERVDEILARKTVRQTIRLSDTPFLFLNSLLDEKQLVAGGVEIAKGDYDYHEDIVGCAAAGYLRGDLSLAALASVYHLHASRMDPYEVLPCDLAELLMNQPEAAPMLPGFPGLMQVGADGLGVADSRRFIAFLLRAWKDKWPLFGNRAGGSRRTIRSCQVAKELVEDFEGAELAKPCIYRWYEC